MKQEWLSSHARNLCALCMVVLFSACSHSARRETTDEEDTAQADAGPTSQLEAAERVQTERDASVRTSKPDAADAPTLRTIVPKKLTAGDTFHVECESSPQLTAAEPSAPSFEPASAVEERAGSWRALRAGKVIVRCALQVEHETLMGEPAELMIEPGKLSKLETKLDKRELRAGDEAKVRCNGEDDFGNATTDPDITRVIMPSAAGNTLEGETLRVKRAGEYTVLCQHPRAKVAAQTIHVLPGLPSSVIISTDPVRAEQRPNETVKLIARAEDDFHNEVKDATITLAVDPADPTDSNTPARFERVTDDTFRFQEGTHAIEASVTSPTQADQPVTAHLDLHVDGGAPRIFCDAPLDGASIVSAEGHTQLTGRVADGSGIAQLTVNGEPVSVQGGSFSHEVPVAYGVNMVEITAVDGVGTRNHKLCSFSAASQWAQGVATRTLRMQLGPSAIDDRERAAPPSSIADLLQTAIESAAFHDAIDKKLQERPDLKPSSCDQSILGGCVMRSGVQYRGLELGGPPALSLQLVEGGLAGHAFLGVVDRVAQAFLLDLVLVEVAVHEHVHGVGEVRIGHFLLVEHEELELLVGLVHGLRVGAGEEVLQFHLHGGGVAAALVVLRAEHDHRVLAHHEHVAAAQFLSDFHRSVRNVFHPPPGGVSEKPFILTPYR